jgi:hypothetical protein
VAPQKNNNEAEGKPFFTTVYAIDALHTHDFGSESRGLELCSAPVPQSAACAAHFSKYLQSKNALHTQHWGAAQFQSPAL